MPILIFGGLFGFLAVALGAFGAHGLEGRLDTKAVSWWETATLYAMVHAVLLTGLGLAKRAGVNGMDLPALAFAIGIFLFAGTLYAMALGAPRWLGAITPLGGIALLIGWCALIWSGLKAGGQ